MKKSILLILSLGLFFIKMNAQVHDPNFTPFAYGASVGGFLCFGNPGQPDLTQVDKETVAGFSFGGAVSFRKRKYYLETGLNFNGEGYAYSSVVYNNTAYYKQNNEYKFYSVMLPLRLVLPVQGMYCKHLPSFAFNLSYAVKQMQLQTVAYENAPETKNVYNVASDYKKIEPSFTIAYGIEFDLDENNAIRFEPTYQFSFVNAKSPDNKTIINNLGLRAYFLFLR